MIEVSGKAENWECLSGRSGAIHVSPTQNGQEAAFILQKHIHYICAVSGVLKNGVFERCVFHEHICIYIYT